MRLSYNVSRPRLSKHSQYDISGEIIAHLNVRSILHKMNHVRLLFSDKKFDIFTFSETCLSPSIKDSEVDITGYSVLRNDPTGKRGGGTAIYVRDGIPYKHRTDIDSSARNCLLPHVCSETFIDALNDSLTLETASGIGNCRFGGFQYRLFSCRRRLCI